MTSRSIPRAFALLSFPFLFAVACGDPENGPGDNGVPSIAADAEEPDGGEEGFPDAMRPDGRPDAGRLDRGVEADSGIFDDDNDFEHATTVMINDQNGLDGVIDPEGDIDYAEVTFPMEGFYIFDITANNDGSPTKLDSVISIFDANHDPIALNDDQIFGNTLDSEIIFHAPAAGTYFVKIEDYSTYSGQTPAGGPEKTYILSVFNNFNPAIVNVETEAGDDVASAQALMANDGFAYVLGTFRDADDVDVYTINVPGNTQKNYTIDVMPTGATGYGSNETGLVWLTDTTGSTITARLDFTQDGVDALAPSLRGGSTYLLHVKHPPTAAAPADFYVIKMDAFEENPAKMGEPANSTMMGAETLALVMTNPRRAFFQGSLGEDDVDYFKVVINNGEMLQVACGSASGGSGIVNLTLEVLTSTGGSLATVHEDLPGNLVLPALTSTGTLYLKLSKDAQDPEVTGDWVRCGVRAIM